MDREHAWNTHIQYKTSWAVNLGVCKVRASPESIRPVHRSPVLSDFPRVRTSQALPHCQACSCLLTYPSAMALLEVTSQTLGPVDHCHGSSQTQPPPHFFPPLPRGGGNRLDVLLCWFLNATWLHGTRRQAHVATALEWNHETFLPRLGFIIIFFFLRK